jgi:hypothetical protein
LQVEKGGRKGVGRLLFHVLGSALVTTLSLAGMLSLVFDTGLLDSVVIHHNTLTEVASGSLLLITILFGSGAIWGLGLGLVFARNPMPIIKSAALHWGASAFLAALILEVVNGFQDLLSEGFGTSRHFIFVTAFVIAVGTVVTWCVYRVFPRISKSARRGTAALVSGWLAALAYLMVDRYMVLQGWLLGTPRIDGVSVMMTVMLNGTTMAALVGGGILGWYLHRAENPLSTA